MKWEYNVYLATLLCACLSTLLLVTLSPLSYKMKGEVLETTLKKHMHHKSRSIPHQHIYFPPFLPHSPQHYHWWKIISKFFQVDQFRAQINRVIIAIHQYAKQSIDGISFMDHLFVCFCFSAIS